ncbi:transcription factor S-II, central domain-containing protein, partial [Myxozyma melibiosi]
PEPRRSSRSTKGFHSALQKEPSPEPVAEAAPKKRARSSAPAPSRKKSKAKKPLKDSNSSEHEEDADYDESVTRCVCGVEEDEDKPLMAQCEKCEVWQHTECTMGVTDEKDVPEQYFCEQCRPDLHTWYFDHKKKEEEAKAEQASKRRKPSPKEKPPPQTSRRKSSTTVPPAPAPAEPASSEKPRSIDSISDNVRKSVAKALFGILQKAATEAVANKSLTLSGEGETASTFAESLTLDIEHALYEHFATKESKDPGHRYRDKFRTISFNLKDAKNSSLRARVLSGEIAPNHIVVMSPDELMNPELQKLAEAVRKESISQSTLQKTEAPRIRRTHKGEEFVGDVDPLHPDSNTQVGSTEEDLDSKSPFVGGGGGGPSISAHAPTDDDRRSVSPFSSGRSYSPDFRSDYSSVSPRGDDFDIDSDADIDRLINSDIEEEDTAQKNEPEDFDSTYSPTLTKVDLTVWKGTINMLSVATFHAKGVQVGGPEFDGYKKSWSDVVPTAIDIDGRLARDRASSYLFSVSQTRDLVGIKFSPQSPRGQDGFDKLYEYFRSRDRYGVMRNKFPAVKDAYLVPLQPGDAKP